MHRSDMAQRTMTAFLEADSLRFQSADESISAEKLGPPHWEDQEGLVQVLDPDVLERMQGLLDATHKTSDNWTRDRGCSMHGVNG
ncbi:unnamed protein product, partial [Effrenium voratum]